MLSADTPRAAGCTIVSPNYLPYARTLATSYLEQHPGQQFYVLLVCALTDPAPFRNEPFQALLLTELGLPDLRHEAMKYDILELNTNVKPSFMKHLLRTEALDQLIYLDPDIFVYAPLAPVFDALSTNDLVLTPHLTRPVDDGNKPSEQDQLYNGTYNLGFAAARNTPGGIEVLDWWERRCLDNGFSEGRTGLFVDQKWMNLAPGLFPHVAILRHLGCNMAYWNLQERTLIARQDKASNSPDSSQVPFLVIPRSGTYLSDQPESPDEAAVPLCFFHFSGNIPGHPETISRHTDRFTLRDRPDLQTIFTAYGAAVERSRNPATDALPYGFDTFSDGTAITRLSRRLFAQHRLTSRTVADAQDPFDATGPWYRFCRAQRLVAGAAPPAKATWQEFSGTDRRVTLVHRLLASALRVLGPNRYELLMRYLSFITVLRHQSVFLNKSLPK